MEYTLAKIKTLCEGDRAAAAEELDAAAIAVDTRMQNDYHLAGVISLGVEQCGIWRELGWDSFSAWFDDRWNGSHSSAWESYSTLGKLQQHVPENEIKAMKRNKRKQLADCPSDAPKKDPELWEAAQDPKVTERQFVDRYLNGKHNQHVELRGPYLTPSDSQKELFDAACRKKREEYQDPTMSREMCFESMCKDYLETPLEVEEQAIAARVQ